MFLARRAALATIAALVFVPLARAADDKLVPKEGGAVEVLVAMEAFDTKGPNFLTLYRQAITDLRTRLAKEAAQDELVKSLPKLSTKQLVLLWDGFWLGDKPNGPLDNLRDLNDLADGFAAKFNAADIAALKAETDLLRRGLLVNMIANQRHTLTKAQAEEYDALAKRLAEDKARNK